MCGREAIANGIFFTSFMLWILKQTSNFYNELFNFKALILPWQVLISTFASILNYLWEVVMALELGCSFLGSFLNSFFGSPLPLVLPSWLDLWVRASKSCHENWHIARDQQLVFSALPPDYSLDSPIMTRIWRLFLYFSNS